MNPDSRKMNPDEVAVFPFAFGLLCWNKIALSATFSLTRAIDCGQFGNRMLHHHRAEEQAPGTRKPFRPHETGAADVCAVPRGPDADRGRRRTGPLNRQIATRTGTGDRIRTTSSALIPTRNPRRPPLM